MTAARESVADGYIAGLMAFVGLMAVVAAIIYVTDYDYYHHFKLACGYEMTM